MVVSTFQITIAIIYTIFFAAISSTTSATPQTTLAPQLQSTFTQTTSHFVFSNLSEGKIAFSGHFTCLQSAPTSSLTDSDDTAIPPVSNLSTSLINICVKALSFNVHLKTTANPYKLDAVTWTMAALPGNALLWPDTPQFSAEIVDNLLKFEFPDQGLPKDIKGVLLEGVFQVQPPPELGVNPSMFQLGLEMLPETPDADPMILTADFLVHKLLPPLFPFHVRLLTMMGKAPSDPAAVALPPAGRPIITTTPSNNNQSTNKAQRTPLQMSPVQSEFVFNVALYSLYNPTNATLTSINVNLIGQFSFHPLPKAAACTVNGIKVTRFKLSTPSPLNMSPQSDDLYAHRIPHFDDDAENVQNNTTAPPNAAEAYANVLTIDLSTTAKHLLNSAFPHTAPISIVCQEVTFASTLPDASITVPPNPLLLSPFITSISVDFYAKEGTKTVLVDSVSQVQQGILEYVPHPTITQTVNYFFNSAQFINKVAFTIPQDQIQPTVGINDSIQLVWQGVLLEQFTMQRYVYAPKFSLQDGSLIYQDAIDTPIQTNQRYISQFIFGTLFPSLSAPMSPITESLPSTTTLHPTTTTATTIPHSFITSTTIKASQINLPQCPRTVSAISQLTTFRLDDPARNPDRVSHQSTVSLFQPLSIPFRQPPEISFKAPGLNLILPTVIFLQNTNHGALTLDLSFSRTSAVFHGNFSSCSLSILQNATSVAENANSTPSTAFADTYGDDEYYLGEKPTEDPIDTGLYPPFDSDEWVHLTNLSGYDVEVTKQKGKMHVAVGTEINMVRFLLTPQKYTPESRLNAVDAEYGDDEAGHVNGSADPVVEDFVLPPSSTLYLRCAHASVHSNWGPHPHYPKDEVLSIGVVQLDSDTTAFTPLAKFNLFSLVEEYQFNGPSADGLIDFTHRGTSITFQYNDNDDPDPDSGDEDGDGGGGMSLAARAVAVSCAIVAAFIVLFGIGWLIKRYLNKKKQRQEHDKYHKSMVPGTQLSDDTQLYHTATPSQRGYGSVHNNVAYEPMFE